MIVVGLQLYYNLFLRKQYTALVIHIQISRVALVRNRKARSCMDKELLYKPLFYIVPLCSQDINIWVKYLDLMTSFLNLLACTRNKGLKSGRRLKAIEKQLLFLCPQNKFGKRLWDLGLSFKIWITIFAIYTEGDLNILKSPFCDWSEA